MLIGDEKYPYNYTINTLPIELNFMTLTQALDLGKKLSALTKVVFTTFLENIKKSVFPHTQMTYLAISSNRLSC